MLPERRLMRQNLKKYIEAMGGEITLDIKFPNGHSMSFSI
jgi:hypothetical protein